MDHRPATPLSLLLAGGLAVGFAVAVGGGCQSLTHAAIAPREDATASVAAAPAPAATTRPMVKVTAADMYSWGPGASAQQLEFYDEVESRDIVAHDDVLHAALLFGRGSSAATFAQRAALAREQGWVDRSFSRPAHEAATVGEVSQIMARVMGLNGSSPHAAVASLSKAGVLPEGLTAQQGISGRQFLALLGRSYDWLQRDQFAASAERPLAARPPAVDLEGQATARGEPRPASPAPAAAEPRQPAATTTPRAMAEPLPDLPKREPVATRTPTPAPAAPAPTTPAAKDQPQPPPPAPAPAPAPAAEEPAKPAAPTPRPWVGGKPLGKKK